MRWTGRIVTALGLAGIVVAAVIALMPLHANGVSGSALRPRYRDFGFVTFVPLPSNATDADLRRAGVRLPGDVVHDRRLDALDALAAGVLVAVSGAGLWTRTLRVSR